ESRDRNPARGTGSYDPADMAVRHRGWLLAVRGAGNDVSYARWLRRYEHSRQEQLEGWADRRSHHRIRNHAAEWPDRAVQPSAECGVVPRGYRRIRDAGLLHEYYTAAQARLLGTAERYADLGS